MPAKNSLCALCFDNTYCNNHEIWPKSPKKYAIHLEGASRAYGQERILQIQKKHQDKY